MNRFKMLTLVLIILFISTVLWAEAPEYNLPTEYVMEFPWMGGGYSFLGFNDGDIFLSSGYRTYRIDPETRTLYKYDKYTEVGKILGENGSRFIIARQKPETKAWYTDDNAYAELFLYDPKTEEYERLNNIKVGKVRYHINNMFYYYSENYLATRYWDESYRYVSIDAATGIEFYKGSGIYGISPDKMHAFIEYPDIINLKTGKKVGEYPSVNNRYFVTNDLFFADNLGHIDVCDLSGEVKAAFNYLVPTGIPDNVNCEENSFKKIMNSEYGLTNFFDGKRHWIIVKTPNEMDYLDELGLLFHQTTASLNDDRVRMREWPLLEAKHLAFLEEGEEVEVLDRSGIKLEIGDMNDYWYKIRRADGTEGWSYGYFLDLAEEE